MLNKILNQLDQLSKDELLTLNDVVIKMARAKSRVESVTKGGIDKLSYPLMADPSLRISTSYGVLQRDLGQALRGTFIINDEGILLSMTINPAWIGRSVDETVRTLQALQSGKPCPAGWRPGRKTL